MRRVRTGEHRPFQRWMQVILGEALWIGNGGLFVVVSVSFRRGDILSSLFPFIVVLVYACAAENVSLPPATWRVLPTNRLLLSRIRTFSSTSFGDLLKDTNLVSATRREATCHSRSTGGTSLGHYY